jgi:hypothetical protein
MPFESGQHFCLDSGALGGQLIRTDPLDSLSVKSKDRLIIGM